MGIKLFVRGSSVPNVGMVCSLQSTKIGVSVVGVVIRYSKRDDADGEDWKYKME